MFDVNLDFADSLEQLYNSRFYSESAGRFDTAMQGRLIYVENKKRVYLVQGGQLIPLSEKYNIKRFTCEKCGAVLKTTEVSNIVRCKCGAIHDLDTDIVFLKGDF